MPDAVDLIRAARYLGVPPWELAEQHIGWRDLALILEGVEAEMQSEE